MQRYTTPTGDDLAYVFTAGNAPLVVFLGGFRSDMTGSKAMALQAACEARGQAFLRFDYHGHGQSAGEFVDGTIGRWKGNALDLIAHVMQVHNVSELVLVGSSMGGWIMTHAALVLGDAVKALVGVAAAPDFTADLMVREFSDAQRAELAENGVVYVPSCMEGAPYPITKALIEDGKTQGLLAREGLLAITCPVALLHGTNDADVPWQTSWALMDKLASKDVKMHIIKDGDHRLSEPAQLEFLVDVVQAMLDEYSRKN